LQFIVFSGKLLRNFGDQILSKSKTSMAYQALKLDLLNGVLEPGAKLKIEQLSSRLDVSPGAVRESLARLHSEGLVIAEQQRGFIAAPISASDLIDLTEVRIDIELRCLHRSIQIGNLSWESDIASAWHQLSNTPLHTKENSEVANPAWGEAHQQFHDSLIAGTDNTWWLKLREQTFTQAERYRRLLIPYTNRTRNVDKEHAALVKAVLARDSAKASDLMQKHLQKTVDILLASDAPFSDANWLETNRKKVRNGG